MNEQEAIELALVALGKSRSSFGAKPIRAFHRQRHMSRGKSRSGWVVTVALDVPEGFEPDSLHVEIYDDTSEVHVLRSY